MNTTKNNSTSIIGFYAKNFKGVELTEGATSKKRAAYLERNGWVKQW